MKTSDADKFSKRFAETVKKKRKEQGLSHDKLAELAGVTRPTISYIESGKKSPTLATCFKLAASLKISLSELINLSE